jgi:hypothetical protein
MSAAESKGKKVDYLKEDKPIDGQDFVLLSFLLPEEVVAKKEAFFVGKFVESLARGGRQLFFELLAKKHGKSLEETENEYKDVYDEVYSLCPENAQEKYKDFLYRYEKDMTKTFNANNGHVPSTRGIKVRGSFATQEEAVNRARYLSKRDPAHHIYVGRVGKWMPILTNPDDVENQEHSNEQLNEIMKALNKKRAEADDFFEKNKEAVLKNNTLRKDGKVVEPETFAPAPVSGVVDTLIKPEFKVVSHSQREVTPDEDGGAAAAVAPPTEEDDGEASGDDAPADESRGLADELARPDPWMQRRFGKK